MLQHLRLPVHALMGYDLDMSSSRLLLHSYTRGLTGNTSGFASHTHPLHLALVVGDPPDKTQMSKCGYFPIKLYLRTMKAELHNFHVSNTVLFIFSPII